MADHGATSAADDRPSAGVLETVRFGFGGPEIELDLSEEHAAGLRSTLAPYIARARRIRRVHIVSPVLRRGVEPELIGTPSL